MPRIKSPGARLRVMDLSLVVEADNFTSSTALREAMAKTTRKARVDLMRQSALATYGTGLINKRSLRGDKEIHLQA